MKLVRATMLLAVLALDCSPATNAKVNAVVEDALNVAEFACIMVSNLTDSAEVAKACDVVRAGGQIAPGLLQYIESLVGQREALKRSGYSFDKPKLRWQKPGG